MSTEQVNPDVYYFKTWETQEVGGFEWAGSISKGNVLIAYDYGHTKADVMEKQDRYVAKLHPKDQQYYEDKLSQIG